MPIRGMILVGFFLVSVPVSFFRPFYGILLWITVAFISPQWYVWSAAYSLPWGPMVAVPTLLGFLLFCRGSSQRLASREVLLIAILFIWFTLTSLLSVNAPEFSHHAEDTWHRWGLVSKVLLMTVVMIGVANDFRRLRVLVLVIAGCFALFVLKALPFMILTGGEFRLYGPLYSMIADNNDFGLALNMTLPIFFFLAQTEPNRWVRRLFGFLFLITIPAIFFTYSRGAMIALAVVLGLMLLRLKRRMILVPVIALGVLVAVLFAPEAWRERMDPTRPDVIDASANSRLNAWTYCWHLATHAPIAGGGFDTFTPELFSRYAPEPRDVHGPHSIYFGVLAEHGFIGLLLYLTLIVSCFLGIHHLIKEARIHEDSITINYANMFRFSLVGFLIAGAFLGRAYFDYFFTIVACTAILRQVSRAAWDGTRSLSLAANEEAA